MDIEKDTWSAIDSYFRDTDDYLVKHHINSYDDFIKRKIPLIFKNGNHKTYYRTDYNDDNILYQYDVYYGGKESKGAGIYISKPTLIDHKNGIKRQLYPNEARLKDLTYGADVFYDVDIEYSMYKIVDKKRKPIYENVPAPNSHFLKRIYLGKVPIMLRSCLCVLNKMEPDMMYQMGESKYETGGYFIIDGAEKVIVSLERRAENKIFLLKENSIDNKFTHVAEVKSASQETFQPARTVKLQMEKSGAITVRFGQQKTFFTELEGRDIPLFIVFRMLGIETDEEILEYICHNLDAELSKKMISLLYPSINDQFILDKQIYDRDSAVYYMNKRVRRATETGKFDNIQKSEDKKMSFLHMAVYENCFPHVGYDFRAKVHYLAYMTNQLLRFVIGLESPTSRDNFINKRIDLSGFLLARSFSNAVRELTRAVDINIQTHYEQSHTEYSGEDFVNVVNESNFLAIFDYKKFQKHFIDAMKKGNIDLSLSGKSGVVQTLERKSDISDLAHLRRITDPVPSGSKVSIDRRRLHSSQYGCVCPLETPEGGNVGLRKSLAILSDVSFGCLPNTLIKDIKNLGLVSLDDIHPREIYGQTKVFVNGMFIGIHLNPQKLYTHLLLRRRNGLFNIYTSIAWYKEKDEIICCTDQGRFCRPLYIVEDNQLVIQPQTFNKLKKGNYKWQDLVSGFAKRKDTFDFFDCKTYPIDHLELNLDIDTRYKTEDDTNSEIIRQLHKNQGVVEYLDAEELNTRMLSSKLNIFQNDDSHLVKYTHCELHPSMVFGTSAFYIAFLQHNPAQRDTMGMHQCKQMIGTYTTSFNQRIDTSAHILHYPERPFAITRLNKAIRGDKLGTGHNITVAISTYGGYNQEDGFFVNRMSLDMGLFNTTLFKRYKSHEVIDEKTLLEEHFYNPQNPISYNDEELPIDTMMSRNKNYGKLDEYGFIKEGEVLEKDDVIFGKYQKIKNAKGIDEWRDISEVVKRDHIGSVVDKVYTAITNANGDRLAKVRLAQMRVPEIGDKFTSRYAQKGTIGIILDPENMPFTSSGIVPDMIINPYGMVSRMTTAQLMEMLCGTLAIECGYFGLASPFEPLNIESVMDALHRLGLNKQCEEIMYDGAEGRMMESDIYMGPIYYHRLKHMVHDKINYRASGHRVDGIAEPGGKYDSLTRQTIAGRTLEGGLRIGEMERDGLLAHGISAFLRESTMERSDKFAIYVSKKTGHISIVNPKGGPFADNIYYNPASDGPLEYYLTEAIDEEQLSNKTQILGLNTSNTDDMEFIRLEIPYAFKLLMQELQGMSMQLKLKVGDNKVVMEDNEKISWDLEGGYDSEEENDSGEEVDNDTVEQDSTTPKPDQEQEQDSTTPKPDNEDNEDNEDNNNNETLGGGFINNDTLQDNNDNNDNWIPNDSQTGGEFSKTGHFVPESESIETRPLTELRQHSEFEKPPIVNVNVHTGGNSLVESAEHNPNIKVIHIDNTSVSPEPMSAGSYVSQSIPSYEDVMEGGEENVDRDLVGGSESYAEVETPVENFNDTPIIRID